MEKFDSLENSAWMNNTTFSAWFIKLYSIALSVFDWTGLPETVDPRFLEMTLFWNGMAAYFSDEIMGQLALPVLAVGPLDVYAIPTQRTAYSYNGYQMQGLTNANSVLIYNNWTRTPDAVTIKQYALRLYQIERSIDVNVAAQKTPILIACDEKMRLTLKNVYMQYAGNGPVIFGSKNLDPQSFSCLKTDAPYIADRLEILKKQYFDEALTYLGVEANTSDKAERMITGEITSDMGATESLRLSRLKARQQAANKINRMFGTNISVDFSSKLNLSRIMDGNGLITAGTGAQDKLPAAGENEVTENV